jgi:hypothetical protein
VKHTLSRALKGPALSRADKADANKSLKEQRATARRKLPFKIPSHKPPLRALFFDSDGRLWVERNADQGTGRIADVYDRGRLVSIVRWPASVRLDIGSVSSTVAYGVQQDDLGAEQPVRLVFRRADSVVSTAASQ